jgi:hypothetical protein
MDPLVIKFDPDEWAVGVIGGHILQLPQLSSRMPINPIAVTLVFRSFSPIGAGGLALVTLAWFHGRPVAMRVAENPIITSARAGSRRCSNVRAASSRSQRSALPCPGRRLP